MTPSRASVPDSAALPPQGQLVGRQFVNGVDGREAVAAQRIHSGDLVLTAAPYAMAMFAGTAPSALVCAAKARPGAGKDTTSHAEGHKGKYAGKHQHNKNTATAAFAHPNDPGQSHADPAEVASENSITFMAASTAFGVSAGPTTASGSHEPEESRNWHLKYPTFCASCFKPIETGRVLLNRDRLQATAVDISVELILLQREIKERERASKGGAEEMPASGSAKGPVEEDPEETAKRLLQQKKVLQKQKKPAKSAPMKKSGVVALKQRLADAAAQELERFVEAYVFEKKNKAKAVSPSREAAPPSPSSTNSTQGLDGGAYWHGRVAHIHCWDENERTVQALEDTFSEGCAGCEHCGVLVFCSAKCWHAHQAPHRDSGECVLLRRVHFALMQHYFAPSAKALAGSLGENGGLVPGSEPSRWMARCSAEKELEMHSLLLASLLAAAAAAEGRVERLKDREMVHVQTPEAKEALASQNADSSSARKESPLLGSWKPRGDTAAATTSVRPKEVTTIEELRRSLDASPAVEVLDAWPAQSTEKEDAAASALVDNNDCSDNASRRSASKLRLVSWKWAEDEAAQEDWEPTAHHPNNPTGTVPYRQQLVGRPSYTDLSMLVTNLSVLPRDRHSLYRCYWRQYLKVVAPLLAFRFPLTADSPTPTPTTTAGDGSASSATFSREGGLWLSESYFHRIGAACQCNSFGVFSAFDVCVASGLYPEASFFNHSCAPNLCRVMRTGRTACFYALRDIEPGEGLTICYTEIQEESSAERRRLLLDGYRFFCQCPRCSGRSESGVAPPTAFLNGSTASEEGFLVRAGSGVTIRLCNKCDAKGYLRPLPPPRSRALPPASSAQSPQEESEVDETAKKVPVRVAACSVCGQRVVTPCAAETTV